MNITKRAISTERLLLFISIAAMCQPLGAGALSSIYSIAKIVGLAYAGILLMRMEMKVDKFIGIVLVFFLYLLGTTYIHDGNLNVWFMQFYMYTAPCVILTYWFNNRPRETISTLAFILCMYVCINLLTYFQIGNDASEVGLTSIKVYWLGIRTRISDIAFLAISCAIISLWSNAKATISRIVVILTVIASIYFIFANSVSTGVIACIIYALVFCVLSFIKKEPSWLSFLAVGIGPLMTMLLLSINFLTKFSYIIQGVLGESLTLNGRTIIWANVIAKLKQSMLFGYGVGAQKSFFVVSGNTGATHNGFLDILYSGGIVGGVLFILLVWTSISKLKQCTNIRLKAILYATVFAMDFVMISEVANTCAYFYIMLCLAYNVTSIDKCIEIESCKRRRSSI